MNASIKMVLVLSFIGMLSGGILSSWESFTLPMIEQHRLEELKAAIKEVLPEHDSYEEKKFGDLTLYIGKKEGQVDPVGIAMRASGNGFQGKVVTMIGLTPDYAKFTGIKVLEQVETPGLGTKIVTDPSNKNDPFWFPNQFKGVETQPSITIIKNSKPTKPNEIQAISGATITSKAVVRIYNETIAKARAAYTPQLQNPATPATGETKPAGLIEQAKGAVEGAAAH